MKSRLIVGALLLPLLVPLTGAAQEGSERGQLFWVETIEVQPSDAMGYEAVVAKVVKAAGEAGLSTDYKWAFWRDLYTYTLVFPISNFAYWDDPNQWERQFEGTPGEQALEDAFAEFSTLNARTVSSEVIEEVADWSYAPAAAVADELNLAHVDELWIKPGKQQEFGELIEEFGAFFGEVGYRYPVDGHRVHFGDTGRAIFVTFYDSKEAYYGANSLDRLIAEKGAGEKWGDLLERLSAVMVGMEHGDAEMQAGMTYWPSSE